MFSNKPCSDASWQGISITTSCEAAGSGEVNSGVLLNLGVAVWDVFGSVVGASGVGASGMGGTCGSGAVDGGWSSVKPDMYVTERW